MDEHRLDEAAALVVLKYYAGLARECEWGHREVIRISHEEVDTLSSYFSATLTSELRLACRCYYEDNNNFRSYAYSVLYHISIDLHRDNPRWLALGPIISHHLYNGADEQKYMRSAYHIFKDYPWSDGFGGEAWAHCTWRAINLISALRYRDGYADRELWEACLGACHNNNRWLNKIGNRCVYSVLCLGFESSPKKILDIYYGDDAVTQLSVVPWVALKTECGVKLPETEEIWDKIYE
jgi:hypothetical protein